MREKCINNIKVIIMMLLLISCLGDKCDWFTIKTDVVQDAPPAWDTDGDNISNAVETNNANSYLNLDTTVQNANPSIAHGGPCGGWIENALNMVNQGTGYYHYNPDKGDPLIDTDDWGVLDLINMIEGAGRLWDWNSYPPPRIGVGDLSKGDQYTQQFGGYFWPHDCHQNGTEADFRYMRNDGQEASLNIADSTQWQYYDVDATVALMNFLIANGNVSIIYVDTVHAGIVVSDPIRHWSGHEDHFHVRILDPDGTGN